jgi:RNA polymerase sporulation-specific sigma factor
MSNEELVKRIKDGETNLLADLWMQVRRFIAKRASVFLLQHRDRSKVDKEDLIQSGYFALLEAIRKYDPEAGSSFINYFNYHLRRRFRMEAGIWSSRRDALLEALSIDDVIWGGDNEDVTFADTIKSEAAEAEFDEAIERVKNEQIANAVKKCMQKLKPIYQEVLIQIYFEQHKIKDIAKDHGLSNRQVTLIHHWAIKRLRVMPAIRKLKRDNYLDLYTKFYKHKSYKAFNTSFSSVVEDLIINREKREEVKEAERRRFI